jgi:hypothetical protein
MFLKWNHGLCVPNEKGISFNKQIAYILLGPITPFVISTSILVIALVFDLPGTVN